MADEDVTVTWTIKATGEESIARVKTALEGLAVAEEEAAEGAEKLTEAVQKLAAAEEEASASKRSSTNLLERLIAQYDKATRAEVQYADAIDKIAQLERDGIGTAERRNQALQLATQQYEKLIATQREATAAEQASVNAVERMIGKYDKAQRIQNQYADGLDRLAKFEREGVGTAEQRARALEQLTANYVKLTTAQDAAIESARAAQNVQNAQDFFNKQTGVTPPTPDFASARSAKESAAVFQELFEAEERARLEAEAIGARIEQLQGKFDPAGTSIRRMNAALADLDEAVARGVPIFGGFEAAQSAIIKRHYDFVNALNSSDPVVRKAAVTNGQLSSAVANLGFQLNDVATGLLSGQSFFTILIQQGTQFQQAATQAGGWSKLISAFGESLTGLLTPTRLVVAGLLAIGAGMAFIVSKVAEAQQALRDFNAVLGRAATPANMAGLQEGSKQLQSMGFFAA